MRPRLIAVVFVIVGAVFIASTLLTFWFGNRVLSAHEREGRRHELIADLDRLTSMAKDAETGQRGYIITGDPAYLEPYNDAVRELPALVTNLESAGELSVNSDEIRRIRNLIDQKLAELQSTIDLRNNAGFAAAASIVQNGQGKRLMDDLRSAVERVKSQESAALQLDARLIDATTRARSMVFILAGLLNLVFLVWAYRRVAESFEQRDAALEKAHRRGREIQEQKDLLGVTLASIGDCVIVTDEKGRINFMNRVAEETTGWTFADARDRPVAEIFRILNEHTREPVESPVEKVLKHGVIVGLANHTLLVRKDGSEIPIDDSGAPIHDFDGKNRGVVLVFRDFSEHKAQESVLREAKQAAETANKAKDQFLAMLSHELRTPLTPVLATLNLWEASEEVPAEIRPDVQMLRRSIELEARIIDDLLDLTRIARGMLSFSPEITDVHGVIEFLVGLSRSEAQSKGLKLSLKLDAVRHHVYTDAARLQQVFWNILRNAIKFTERGTITITTSNNLEAKIDIAVADSGIGMTPETISRLFVPFEQADRAQAKRYGGLGLGMAISGALIELLEGMLTAKSEGLGRGSTFTITFPAVEAPAQKKGEPSEPSTIGTEKLKLLLVEDHADTARALVRLLESRGFRISCAGTVAGGLELVQRESFDLLLCDLGLPDGTGLELIEEVRRSGQHTPAIALTGFGMQQDVERAVEAGFDAHLTKPVNVQKLESTIWRLVQDRQ